MKTSSNRKNIESRVSLGIGVMTQILLMLEELCVGVHTFEAGVMLREAMFVNSVLFCCEAWYGLKKQEIKQLEDVDLMLLKKLLNSHSRVASESVYLELGVTPLEYLIRSRRLMFLKYILSQEDSELIQKIFMAQVEMPLKNDWWLDVEKDLASFNINMTFEEIKSMKKESFAKLVKDRCKQTVLKDLTNRKNTHSKMKDLTYNKLEMRKYLKISDKWSASTAYKFRTRMSEIGENFHGKYGMKPSCPMVDCIEIDTQKHLSDCIVLQSETGLVPEEDFNYSDLFGEEPEKVIRVAKYLELVLKKRTEVVEKRAISTE